MRHLSSKQADAKLAAAHYDVLVSMAATLHDIIGDDADSPLMSVLDAVTGLTDAYEANLMARSA